MDYFPKIFSQNDLFWLDNLMPSSNKTTKSKKKSKKLKEALKHGNEEEMETLKSSEA